MPGDAPAALWPFRLGIDPAPGPADEYGYGVVNPYRALTERAAVGPPASAAPVAAEAVDPASLARERRWRADAVLAGIAVAVVAVLAVLLAMAPLLAVLPAGMAHAPEPVDPLLVVLTETGTSRRPSSRSFL